MQMMEFIDERRIRMEVLQTTSRRARGLKREAKRHTFRDGMPEPEFIAEHVRDYLACMRV
jgi:hypothetical protein